MWNSLKKLFFPDPVDLDSMATSIQKLVNANALNKRKNIRIQFPHISASGPFPRVHYKDSELLVANISVGGLLVIDDTHNFGTQVGEVVHLEFSWPDLATQVRARLVGAHGDYRHIQFVDFDPQVFLRVSQMVKPGHLGGRFHRVQDHTGRLQATELWVGPSQESIVFGGSQEPFAELVYHGEKITFQNRPTPAATKNGHNLSAQNLHEVLILLSNLPKPTPLVRELIELVDTLNTSSSSRKTG
jgi:hypothetical protein